MILKRRPPEVQSTMDGGYGGRKRINFSLLDSSWSKFTHSFHLFRILLDKWLGYYTRYLAESGPCVAIKEWMAVEKN